MPCAHLVTRFKSHDIQHVMLQVQTPTMATICCRSTFSSSSRGGRAWPRQCQEALPLPHCSRALAACSRRSTNCSPTWLALANSTLRSSRRSRWGHRLSLCVYHPRSAQDRTAWLCLPLLSVQEDVADQQQLWRGCQASSVVTCIAGHE